MSDLHRVPLTGKENNSLLTAMLSAGEFPENCYNPLAL
jgi:hypothetical protein